MNSFVYARDGEVYAIEFYQNVNLGFNYEIVMYNPLDKHKEKGKLPLLIETGHKNWKYLVYD